MRIATGAERPRNDRGFTRGAVYGGTHGSRSTAVHFVGQGPCALPGVQHKTDGRTEASAPTEGKRKFIRYRAGGVEPRPYGGQQGGRKKNPPVTAAPCQPPLGKGAMKTGDADCKAGARTGFVMTGFLQGGRYKTGGRTGASAPTGGYGGDWVQAAGWGHPALRSVTGSAVGRDDVGIVPYGGVD